MLTDILSKNISKKDKSDSLNSLKKIIPYLLDSNTSLVFFVGAGISSSGIGAHMPSTTEIIKRILLSAIKYQDGSISRKLKYSIEKNLENIGFEIMLNDLLQICRKAAYSIYSHLAKIEKGCVPNQAHTFLADWLSKGGNVVTTNWDCLIERDNEKIKVIYKTRGLNSFAKWKDNLEKGGCLFKLHGSLEEPKSCLGALEHVRTRLRGKKADLLSYIIKHKPLCFVGWSGKDPDIPPILYEVYEKRDPSLPIFWLHFEGNPPGTRSIAYNIKEIHPVLEKYANNNPILTEANRAFGKMLNFKGEKIIPLSIKKEIKLDLSNTINRCSKSGISRFTGIILRRIGLFNFAELFFKNAKKVAATNEERSAVIQEMALLIQQIEGRHTDKSIRLLKEAYKLLKGKNVTALGLSINFGMLSMVITGLRFRPWSILKLPILFYRYRKNIKNLSKVKNKKKMVVLHKALISLYLGRLRFKLFGRLTKNKNFLNNWIIKPFDYAYSLIGKAGDIHIHSYIDVLVYRTIALAQLGYCKSIRKDFREIDRLIKILNDNARMKHWNNQKKYILKNLFL